MAQAIAPFLAGAQSNPSLATADSVPSSGARMIDQNDGARWILPTVLESGVGVQVLLGTARTLRLSARAPLSSSSLACLDTRRDRDAIRRAVDTTNVWRALDSATATTSLAVVQVIPISFSVDPCAIEARGDASIVARGMEFSTTRSLNGVFQPDSISVAVRGRAVIPSRYGRAVATFPFDSSHFSGTNTATQYRVYFPTSLLEPDRDAHFPAVTVTAYVRNETAQQIEIPERLVRRLWDADLPFRSHANGGAASGRQLALPQPAEPTLRRALTRYDAGDFAGALTVALARLQEASSNDQRRRLLDQTDRRDGSMLVAASLLALNDTAAAGPFLKDALGDAPCLTLPRSAPAQYVETLNRLRPLSRCRFLSSSASLRALALPGLGHFMTGERRTGAVVFATVAAAGLRAILLEAGVRRDYAAYQDARSVAGAVTAYDNARGGRDVARGTALTAAALWLADGVFTFITERHGSSAAEAVRPYGACSNTDDNHRTSCAP